MQSPSLRVIADGNNAIGDTLTRLVMDLFGTLGYDDCRINIHKTGRELDIKGRHAFEDKMLVAECKAQKQSVGGADINKFIGAVDAERRLAGQTSVHGYFISISGYKESAKEQEEELGNARVILLDNSDIVTRICASNIVVPAIDAAEAAGRFAANINPRLRFDNLELIAHSSGWLWAAYFLDESRQRYACLVHADGQIVDNNLYPSLKIDDVTIIGAPNGDATDSPVSQLYRDYLVDEYGVITLDGLPMDQEIGSRPFRLEDLYVPLELQRINTQDLQNVDERQSQGQGEYNPRATSDVPPGRKSIGDLLGTVNRVSVLGPPGSGKSTLIKRLAVAYADRQRMPHSDDDLPENEWFPLVIQCRHLGTSLGKPIHEILQESFLRTERPDLMPDFSLFLGNQLRSGNLLLLVDGLDEIRATGPRAAFVSQLRTFLARYPCISLVLTSREVGFRQVANAMYSICTPYRVSEMSDESIASLVRMWQRHVAGTDREAEIAVSKLIAAIIHNDRVRRLAVNPLLLTTLLLVRRWVGQLPRKRTVLYQKAIEVLLMTWNVQSHDPIDLDEALPQLGYAAYRMMKLKESAVSAADLSRFFQEARNDLPELLAYSTLSVQTFLGQVEERSSLLILSGHMVADGEIVPIYEFKHLTFQEYLAALALVNRWLPKIDQEKTLRELLNPVLEESDWSEVVTMAAVLAGRGAGEIVERLIELTDVYEPEDEESEYERGVACSNLIGCLGDDVQLVPDLASRAITSALLSDIETGNPGDLCESCLGGRYYPMLTDIVLKGVREPEFMIFALAAQRMAELAGDFMPDSAAVLNAISTSIRSKAFNNKIMGTALLMSAAYLSDQAARKPVIWPSGFRSPSMISLRTSLDYVARELMKGTDEVALTWMQTWAIAWGGPVMTRSPDRITALRTVLFEKWIQEMPGDLSLRVDGRLAAFHLSEVVARKDLMRKLKGFLLTFGNIRNLNVTC